jgi:hypothetical protein
MLDYDDDGDSDSDSDSDIYDMYLYCYFGKCNLHGTYFGNMESDSGMP